VRKAVLDPLNLGRFPWEKKGFFGGLVEVSGGSKKEPGKYTMKGGEGFKGKEENLNGA